jgi:hypothetical protein
MTDTNALINTDSNNVTAKDPDTSNEEIRGDHTTMARDGLSDKQVIAYSVGHFNNDLCAAQWFVYLSWYIKNVVNLTATVTGLCLLSG